MPGENVILRFKRVTENAFPPIRGSEKAAGLDLKSAYNVTIPPRGRLLCKTDLQVAIPPGHYGRVAPRSGLALREGIDVGAGVIDEDYRGDLGIVLFNHSDTKFVINAGDRIAQLICEKISYPTLVEVDNLDSTERGEGGFGSTGQN